MSLQINLYHEIQKQARARQRDPLKIGLLGLLVVAVGFLMYYFYRVEHVHSLNVRVAALEQDWAKYEPKQKAAKAREDELNANIKTSEILVSRIESRFFWAPILGQILESAPRTMQFTKLNGDLPHEGGKSIVLTVTGVASSDAPRTAAEDLRTALDEKFAPVFKKVESRFSALDDTEETVAMNGKTCPTANFTIEFQLHNTEPEPTPAPVASRKKTVAATE